MEGLQPTVGAGLVTAEAIGTLTIFLPLLFFTRLLSGLDLGGGEVGEQSIISNPFVFLRRHVMQLTDNQPEPCPTVLWRLMVRHVVGLLGIDSLGW